MNRSQLVPRLILLFFTGILLSCLNACKPQPTVVVETPVGKIGGNDAGTYQSFLGIPYAQPPEGNLRWKMPQPLPPFSNMYVATQFGDGCNQFAAASDVFKSSENCLFLNIWRPGVKQQEQAGKKRPVMIYIHGGAFSLGASSEPQYNGSVLAAERDVLVVSMNYRMSYLGFLSLPELTAEAGHSGNYAFYDQQLALRWVHDNIAAFGGDPDRVMLFGESAGAMSTCVQLASPLSAPLFHSAAIQSGFCPSDVMTQQDAEYAGEIFAAKAGCAQGDRLACLRSKSVDEIDAAMKAAGVKKMLFSPFLAVPVTAVVDGVLFSEKPMDLLAKGAAAGKTVIIGTNKNEGTLFTFNDKKIPTATDYLNLLRDHYGANAEQVAALYPFSAYPSGVEAYAAVKGDSFFSCGAKATAEALTTGGSNVYFYEFIEKVSSPLAKLLNLFAPKIDFGTLHSSDVPYVFGVNSMLGNINGERGTTAKFMQSYWVNALVKDDPNANGLPDWPRYETGEGQYLLLNETPKTAANFKTDKCALLNALPLLYP